MFSTSFINRQLSSLQKYLHFRRKLLPSSIKWHHFPVAHSMYVEVTVILIFPIKLPLNKKAKALALHQYISYKRLMKTIQCGKAWYDFPVVTPSHFVEPAVFSKRSIFQNHQKQSNCFCLYTQDPVMKQLSFRCGLKTIMMIVHVRDQVVSSCHTCM